MAKVPQSPVVVVTGASQGIGQAIALGFAAQVPGVRLALLARNRRNLERVASACLKRGASKAEVFVCDVANEASVAEAARAVFKGFKAVDAVINNAGHFEAASLETMSVEQFDRQIAVNLRSVFLVAKGFVPAMARRGRGDLFITGSVAGLRGFSGGAGYCSAKFGVTGLAKVLREEYRAKGVRIACVYPGATVSPSWKGSGVPASRMMPAEDIAQAFVSLFRMSRRTVVEDLVLRPQLGDL